MKALVIGATGATGRDLVDVLLGDSRYSEVVVFVRRGMGISNPKLVEHIVDYEMIDEWNGLVAGDVLFSCLGTTLKDAGGQMRQWHVDYDYQMQCARAARENGVEHVVLVSSMGADARSRVFYMRMKGRIEEDMRGLKFPTLSIMQPPSLIRKGSKRLVERIGVRVLQWLNRIGLFRSQRPMPTRVLAEVMAQVGSAALGGVGVFDTKGIYKLHTIISGRKDA